jgi:hypothetical protein
MLRCSKCKETKPVEGFAKNKCMKTGYANQCKKCTNEYSRSQKNLENRKKRRDRDWVHALVIECRSRARKLGIPFNIDEADLKNQMICPVLGIPMFRTPGKCTENSPTVDRIYPALGYVRGNVCVISWKANRLKGASDDPGDFEAIAAYIRRSKRPKSVAA